MKHQKVIFTGGVFVGVLVALSMSASADRLSQFNQLAEEKLVSKSRYPARREQIWRGVKDWI